MGHVLDSHLDVSEKPTPFLLENFDKASCKAYLSSPRSTAESPLLWLAEVSGSSARDVVPLDW